MNSTTSLLVWSVVIVVVFAIAWRLGWLAKITTYVQQTREELRKCTWPNSEELWGSTVLVMVATLLLGVFTVIADFAMAWVIRSIV
ncbi:MAG: preprotein translocase subunit SecE [Limisphaerales bacterium]